MFNLDTITRQAVAAFSIPEGQTFYQGHENLTLTFQVRSGAVTGATPWNQTQATTTEVTIVAYAKQERSERFDDLPGTDLSFIRLSAYCVSPTALPDGVSVGMEGDAVYTDALDNEWTGRFKLLPIEQEQFAAIQTGFGQRIYGLMTITGGG